jgi:serine/threonine-protein kinase
VFKAIDRTDQGVVALKVLLPEVAQNPTGLQRFVDEARLLIELRHPGLVEGNRVAKEKGVYFCVMELIEGETALEPLLRSEAFSEARALDIVRQVASALDYMHGEGLVHKDVKPGNIMLHAKSDRAVLIDLGFAARSHAEPDQDSERTVGTVEYIAPEQAQGRGDLDSRADIYSLGATLYHLVVGELPFLGSDDEEILRKQLLESLSSEKILRRKLSPHLHYFIEKMMAKEREIRYQTPAELLADMAAQLEGREAFRSPAAPARRKPPARPTHRRRRFRRR